MSAETIAKFRIGYAPESFNDMRDRLGKHFDEGVLRGSGLFSWKEQEDGSGNVTAGQMYAKFRKRITFPIANEQGKTIAFTARALDSAEQDAKAGPKYLNSPETMLYTKGHVLFNLDKAKAPIRELQFALLVEGQMDCISVFTAGIQNVIATSGTAFTESQVRLLSRFTKKVILNFDPDTAGANAAEKTLALLTEEDFEVRVMTLEDGLDPDRYIRERGLAAYSAAVRGAQRHADYLIERARVLHPGSSPEAKVRALNFLLPHIRRLPNELQRIEFANNAAQKMGIDSALMLRELKRAATQRLESISGRQPILLNVNERVLLRALVLPDADAARQRAVAELEPHPNRYAHLSTARMMEVLVHAEAPSNPMEIATDEQERLLLANALFEAVDESRDSLVVQVEQALATLAAEYLERRQREVRVSMSEAHRKGDRELEDRLAGEMMEIQRGLRGRYVR